MFGDKNHSAGAVLVALPTLGFSPPFGVAAFFVSSKSLLRRGRALVEAFLALAPGSAAAILGCWPFALRASPFWQTLRNFDKPGYSHPNS